MKRRDFIKSGTGALLTMPFILNYRRLSATPSGSALVTVRDDRAFSLKYKPGQTPNEDNVIPDVILSTEMDYIRIARMVDTAVMKLTGKTTVGRAWESLFPPGYPRNDTTILLKVNFSYNIGKKSRTNNWLQQFCPFAPKSPMINAIVNGLLQMNGGTFPVENITVFDSTYRPEVHMGKLIVQGFRPVKPNGLGIYKESQRGSYTLHLADFLKKWEFPSGAPQFTAAPDFPENYRARQRINSSVYHSDFMINITHAKDHRAAGITGVMKNTYGCTNNPMGTHGWDWNAKDNPYPGTGICVPVFYREITRQTPCVLNIIDAFSGLYQGGPLSGLVFSANTIAVSRDPVVLDSWELHLINRVRKSKGYLPITTANGHNPDGHPNASFLKNAVEVQKLGSPSLQNIREYNLSNTAGEYVLPSLPHPISFLSAVERTGGNVQVNVLMDRSGRSHTIRAVVKNPDGQVIRSFKTIVTKSNRASLRWNHKNDNRITMPPGLYLWEITVDGRVHTGTINDYDS